MAPAKGKDILPLPSELLPVLPFCKLLLAIHNTLRRGLGGQHEALVNEYLNSSDPETQEWLLQQLLEKLPEEDIEKINDAISAVEAEVKKQLHS
jgi:hypothetical protein